MLEDQDRTYEETIEQRFLTAMSSLAATVCVIAASSPSGERFGITATAVCSLSTTPPQLVACVNRGSSMAKALTATGWFSVNILSHSQESIAATFAGRTGLKGSDRFANADWSQHTTGTPTLDGATAVCVCHLSNSLHQASHMVVIGRVLDALLCEGETPLPLMYHQRRFTTVSPDVTEEPK
ncbi:flavin reductase family protein [Flexivirga caeni]|uniref:Flavin reductase n=1 Tax=Flexivirga caeni TaxID=2294115 RepID=A0A3M9LYP0_9MICO|nr:flavin reductase family protein [Flexivirga caeni]RNI18414.1 flavin reductase [Flexivirga caeni]